MARPFVHLNVAATADGKIDTFERHGAAISSARDNARVDKLRADSDAVMIGSRTLHGEDPKLTVKSGALRAERLARGQPENPAKVAVASRLELKAGCNFLMAGPARILLFTTGRTAPAQLEMLGAASAEVHVLGDRGVDLRRVLNILKEGGIQRLMLEGGASLNFEMLRLGLVDVLTIFLAPRIFGGESAPTLADGVGLPAGAAVILKLLQSQQWEDGGVLLHYQVQRGR